MGVPSSEVREWLTTTYERQSSLVSLPSFHTGLTLSETNFATTSQTPMLADEARNAANIVLVFAFTF